MDRKIFSQFLPLIIFFITITTFLISGKQILERWQADQGVLMVGNLMLFVITLLSFILARRGMSNPNPYAFVRSVYISIMIKLFVCMIAAFIYISAHKAALNKPALFGCMGFYLIYTFAEVALLMKMLKRKKNA